MAKRRKKRTHVRVDETTNPDAFKIPKSFVFRSGLVGKAVNALVRDMRKVMEPNTALRLRESKNNRLRDYVSVSGQLAVTHFFIFTRTDHGTNLRIARSPRGPTLCFRVVKYSLTRDILSAQLNPKSPGAEYRTSPLLVLNNFGEDSKQIKLMTTMFQNMFPPINVKTMQLTDARRVVLFSYNNETKRVDFRHYNICIKPVGISKSIKRIITSNIPDLHKFNDISEYVLREAQVSDSEAESGIDATVTLAQDYVGRNNKRSEQRAIKLTELGPRMELQLVKIQSGLCDGEVLFHEFIHKTPEEIKKMQQERERRKQLVAMRRKQQEVNVEKRKAKKEDRLATVGAQRPNHKITDDESEFESYGEGDSDDCQSLLTEEEDYGIEDEFSDIEQKEHNSHGKDDYNANNLFYEDMSVPDSDSSDGPHKKPRNHLIPVKKRKRYAAKGKVQIKKT